MGVWNGVQRAVLRLTFGNWNQRRFAALNDDGHPNLRNSSQSELDSLAAETHALLQNIPDKKALTDPFGTLMQAEAHVTQRTAARSPKDYSKHVRDESVDQPNCTLSSGPA